nr:50S ribosomal protein L17 [Anaerolineae bacterium]
MRHRVHGRKLGRTTKQRKALRRNLITQLFMHEQIRTTLAKAKEIRSQSEKLITLARNRGDAERLVELAEDRDLATLERVLTKAQARRLIALVDEGNDDALVMETRAIASHAQRLVARDIHDREVVHKLFHDIAPRYWDRPGGYTRIVRAGHRKGDAAEMAYIGLVAGDQD